MVNPSRLIPIHFLFLSTDRPTKAAEVSVQRSQKAFILMSAQA